MSARVLGLILIASLLASCGKTGRRPQSWKEETSSAIPDSMKEKLGIVLAQVGDEQITYGDLRAFMLKRSSGEVVDRHVANPDIFHAALSSLVSQFVWEQAARSKGVKLYRDEYMELRALETQLYATHYMKEVLEPLAQPSDQEVQKYYDANIEKFRIPARVAARHIQVATQAEAERLKKEVEGGSDFAVLARRYSLDENTRDLGGALGWIQVGSPVLGLGDDAPFVSSVLLMEPGELAVIQGAKAWHLVKAEKKEGGGPQPLSEVRDRIASILRTHNFSQVFNDQLDREQEKMHVHYEVENIAKVTGAADSPHRLMVEAAQERNPLGRIELYRRLAYDFPDEREAPEAQFMIAYINLVTLRNPDDTRIALDRLNRRFRRSRWQRAGEYLRRHLDTERPDTLGTPAEILAKSGK